MSHIKNISKYIYESDVLGVKKQIKKHIELGTW